MPQALWNAYGDRDRLAAHYPAMVLHLESVERDISPTGLWDLGNQLGDWLDPDAPPDEPAAAKADPSVVATACLVPFGAFAAEAAGDPRVRQTMPSAGRSSPHAPVRPSTSTTSTGGLVRSDCATVYALAITFDVLDGDDRAAAGDRLAELVRASGYRVTTGFAGTPFVTWALSETGHVDDAYRLLLESECPSWLYPVTMGATTIWERWDSMLPDGTINAGEMTSFNHYALGAVADWIYQVVGGIRPAAPGYAACASSRPRSRHQLGRDLVRVDRTAPSRSHGGRMPSGFTLETTLPDGAARRDRDARRSHAGGRWGRSPADRLTSGSTRSPMVPPVDHGLDL